MRERPRSEKGKVRVFPFDGQVFQKVYVCYDCYDRQWDEFDTEWMDRSVAVLHRLEGHDVRELEVIPDEGIITLSGTAGLKGSPSLNESGSGGMRE